MAGHRSRTRPLTELYQPYTPDEDRVRTNQHYALPAEFFTLVTGGEWHTYSGNLWDGASTATQSQEKKLDRLAELLRLRSGQRVLDVGCGWGGPLVYLSRTYGVTGVGLTLSPAQKAWAEARALHHRVNVRFVERHWQDYRDAEQFDAVYCDEASVHFQDLFSYFKKMWELLRANGLILNKDLHFAHPRYSKMSRTLAFVNEIFGETGNYRTLSEELRHLADAGFDLRQLEQIPMSEYWRTIDGWLENVRLHRRRMEELVGATYYRRYRKFLEIGRRYLLNPNMISLDVVLAQKSGEAEFAAEAV